MRRDLQDRLLLVLGLLAVYHLRVIATFVVEGPNFLCVVDRTCNRDQLMLRSTLSKFLQFFKAAIDDMLVAGPGKGDASTEPLLLLEFEHFVEAICAPALIGKAKLDLGRRNVAGF